MIETSQALQQALRDLEAGTLSAEGLENATEEARSLYERLLVLRHKARETKAAASVVAPPVPAMRLDTRPVEISPRQTSLIDAIAETEEPKGRTKPAAVPVAEPAAPVIAEEPIVLPKPMPTEKEKPVPSPTPAPSVAKPTAPPTLAARMEHGRVQDLHKAIALSQKFWFLAELFQGKRDRYEQMIDRINGASSLEEAQALFESDVVAQLTKPPAAEVTATFMDLLERRFR